MHGHGIMLTCKKDLFSLPAGLHYLNCAFMAPLSKPAEAAGIEALRRARVPTSIRAENFFTDSDRARTLFARLVNAPDPRRIAIIPSVSYGMATAARNLPRERGQNVVLAHDQFPSNVYVWRRLCREEGLELRVVAPPEEHPDRTREWNARLLEAIDGRTAVVALGHVHWTDGVRFDLEPIGQRARERGAALVVDGTQSVGALPFDVQRLQPDALICAGYKWLMGPYSIGLAYYGPRFDDGVPLEETWIARAGSEDFRGLVNYRDEYQGGALRYDVGERSNFLLVPMLIAALEQLLEWKIEEIQAYCCRLTVNLVEEARALGFGLPDEEHRSAHLLGLRAPRGADLARVQRLLEERNIAVALRGGAMRVSPNVYNDEADIDALREVLREAR